MMNIWEIKNVKNGKHEWSEMWEIGNVRNGECEKKGK